jgi:hypothetical protein
MNWAADGSRPVPRAASPADRNARTQIGGDRFYSCAWTGSLAFECSGSQMRFMKPTMPARAAERQSP